jgi:hypothetical protein
MKIVNNVFPLASSANRIALLTGIVAGTVGDKEVEAAMLKDSESRRRAKPVRAEGIYFASVTEAAKVLVTNQYGRLDKDTYYRKVQAKIKQISRMCTEDCHDGYFWEN